MESDKLLWAIGIFFCAILGTYLPLVLKESYSRLIPILTAFAGGVCMTVGTCHLLVDAGVQIKPLFKNKNIFFANLFSLVGFLVLLVVEQIAESIQDTAYNDNNNINNMYIDDENISPSDKQESSTSDTFILSGVDHGSSVCCQGRHPYEYQQPLEPYPFIIQKINYIKASIAVGGLCGKLCENINNNGYMKLDDNTHTHTHTHTHT
eukprot:GHVR01193126.1.p1 GENE.GHVR01193126.1~~GHVR01193126.1.p1  ORF type:complete len:207 (-),score=89.20 GHVR01193126.1:100-720(-)